MNENRQSDPGSDVEAFVARLEALFESNGAAEYLGEPVTMADHMLQGAAVAEKSGLPATVIVAALLHDIGHLESPRRTFSMDDSHDRVHEDAGAYFLWPYLPAVVVDCVRLQVAVKRYLCATRPDYLRCLSDASIYSLQLQGGPMGEDGVAVFAREPNLEAILQVRYLDDSGKRQDMRTPPVSHFLPLVSHLAELHMRSVQDAVSQ